MFSHLYKREHFEEDEVRLYIAEIVLAIEQLHNLCVIYRDIKLENILLDADGHIMITDYGLSKELPSHDGRSYSFCGTIEYMAPGNFRLNYFFESFSIFNHSCIYFFLQRWFAVAEMAMTSPLTGGRWACCATSC